MENLSFTHPEASWLAKEDRNSAIALVKNKTRAIMANGTVIIIDTFFCKTMHSQEASQFELRDKNGGVIAFFANGQFWSAIGKNLVTLM